MRYEVIVLHLSGRISRQEEPLLVDARKAYKATGRCTFKAILYFLSDADMRPIVIERSV